MIFNNKMEALLYQGMETGSSLRWNDNVVTVKFIDIGANTVTVNSPEGEKLVIVDQVELIRDNKPYVIIEEQLLLV